MNINLNKNNSIKYCTICRKPLSQERVKQCSKNCSYQCRSCEKDYQFQYHRKYVIGVTRNGKQVLIYGNKRPYPKDNRCEICNKCFKLLAYHHWNDTDLSKGLWCDMRCHLIVEGVEKIDSIEARKYLKLKNQLGE